MYEQQSYRVQPSMAFTNAVSSGKEKEVYIDGTSNADEMSTNQGDYGSYRVKERPRHKNPCKQLLRYIRSKNHISFYFLF